MLPVAPRGLFTWTFQDGQYMNKIDYCPIHGTWKSAVRNSKTLTGPDSSIYYTMLRLPLKLKRAKSAKQRNVGAELDENETGTFKTRIQSALKQKSKETSN